MSKSIRVEDDTHAALAALKGEDEAFDELLSCLIRERRETAREGTGFWERHRCRRNRTSETKRDETGHRLPMTLYDSGVLIDYLGADADAVEYVEAHLDERAATTPLAIRTGGCW